MSVLTALVPVLGSTLGKIFQPLFQAMAWLLAFFYALVPNYAIAIALLTVVVMIVTAPLTVKSTRSMSQMQRLAPELKKLQQKYKGDKQKLNEEMMNLYRENGVNPASGCLPMVIQFPVFIILYDVIRGLTNTVTRGKQTTAGTRCVHGVCASPRYIGVHTRLFSDLVHAGGKMPAFGINLAGKLLGQHSVVSALPYAGLILIAIALQYLQMRQLNNRNKAFAQANPQAQMMQRYMPLIMAVIYVNIAAGVNVYFIVSSLCRMGLQQYTFQTQKQIKPQETRVAGTGAAPRRKTLMERLADAQRNALEAQQARQAALQSGSPPVNGNGAGRPRPKSAPPASGNGARGRAAGPAGTAKGGPDRPGSQSRSRSKKPRKAR